VIRQNSQQAAQQNSIDTSLSQKIDWRRIRADAPDASFHIDRIINSGQPVSVGFPLELLRRRSSQFLDQSQNYNRYLQQELHTAVVIGREMREGLCRYRLRNTWGENACHNRRSGYGGRPCENGDFFLTAEELNAITIQLEWTSRPTSPLDR
jgi:hypothetical protein